MGSVCLKCLQRFSVVILRHCMARCDVLLTAGRELHNRCDHSQRHYVRYDLPAAESDRRSAGHQGPASEASPIGDIPQDHGGEAASTDDVDRLAGRHDDHQGQSAGAHGCVRLGGKQSPSYTGARGSARCRIRERGCLLLMHDTAISYTVAIVLAEIDYSVGGPSFA